MKLFDVYPLNDITIVKGRGSYVWDDTGQKYLDLYGGHAVISIGHTHPHYVKRLEDQLHKVGFYSNSVKIPLQVELAEKLGRVSGKPGVILQWQEKGNCLYKSFSWKNFAGCCCYR